MHENETSAKGAEKGRAVNIYDVIRAETDAEQSIRQILLDLQAKTGRTVEWVKVEVRDALRVTVNTISK